MNAEACGLWKILSAREEELFDLLAAHPTGIRLPKIKDAIFVGICATSTIPTLLYHLRRKIRPLGYEVEYLPSGRYLLRYPQAVELRIVA